MMERETGTSALERVLLRDRAVVFAALLTAVLLAWVYLAAGIGTDESMVSMPGMSMVTQWTPSYFALMAAMWVVMMVAMMLPSASPMVLLFAVIERRRRGTAPYSAAAKFALAYIVVWTAIGLAGTALQWQFDRLSLLTPTMALASATLVGIILIVAGVYQFTPLKHACLRKCRSPLEFISEHWNRGPFGLGLLHGLYCVGCCWLLMVLLFVGGVMNLLWVGALAAVVLIEKIAPRGRWAGHAVGVALIFGGVWQLAARALL